MHKYLLKAFYTRTNKKEYNLQIWQGNVRHTHIITIKNIIILEKTREKEELLEGSADTTTLAEITRLLSPIHLAWRYGWPMRKADIEAAMKLGLTEVTNYWKQVGQVEMELDWLHDWISALVIFVRHL